ncbi:MAG TPA: sialate O-acetylesterase [Opitutus sp.]|nr:sialate O-acetylesterase [Opitutus sp.]
MSIVRASRRRRLRAGSLALLAWIVTSAPPALRADVELAPLFRDHAVLQRGQPVPVWGFADPGEQVTVSFHGTTVRGVAGADRRWSAILPAEPANAQAADLVVSGRSTVTVRDVVVGDVWLCSGQSNMGRMVGQALESAREIASADYPLLRVIAVHDTVADQPATTVGTTGWKIASPETAAHFTAVGYFFARELYEDLGVPIGIIHSSFGGTRIEAWMSAAALASDPDFASVTREWREGNVVPYAKRKADYDGAVAAWQADEAAAKAAGAAALERFHRERKRPSAPMGPQQAPSALFNAMINPLVPGALRGVVWYQGESNAWGALAYRKLFPALIRSWREHFGRPDLPFYWVQLAGYDTGHNWAGLREAQTMALALPHTGQAVAIDVGEAADIHPRDKQAVGHRLALIARAKTYGEDLEYSGPMLRDARRAGAAWRLSFTHAAGGLVALGGEVEGIEIAGSDRVFHPAPARIEGGMLLVDATADVPQPVAVRYAWQSYPRANLYNQAGLPAVPFRTDDW